VDSGSLFTIAWSSWGQDGDGWGIFTRTFNFDGNPIVEEHQANIEWLNFQWKPQIVWCQGTLWALWLSYSPNCVPGQNCAYGPSIRPLFVNSKIVNRSEQSMDGNNVVVASVARVGNGGKVRVSWLESSNARPRMRIASPEDFRPRRVSNGHVENVNRSVPEAWTSNKPISLHSFRSQEVLQVSGQRLSFGVEDSGGIVSTSTVSMTLSRHTGGLLTAQMIRYETSGSYFRTYPKFKVSEKVQFVGATWDVGSKPLANVMCWSEDGTTQESFFSAYYGMRCCSLQTLVAAQT